ncbi:class II glutamine amidotransferase [Bacteriovoracaceae bacterium]|nr:class II glutamine amidotransferase [Bacteriovoracaceae bacterium]
MCKLFGFRSILNSKVHSSLIEAENSLFNLGSLHPDGWGLAYYVNQIPHLHRSTEAVHEQNLFQKISGQVSSQTFMAHIRKATQGNKDIQNCHPFQFGLWIFCHNGNIKNYQKEKSKFLSMLPPELSSKVYGESDSEFLFYFLTQDFILSDQAWDYNSLAHKITSRVKQLVHKIGKLDTFQPGDIVPHKDRNYLTFLLSDGNRMFGFNGGIPLFYCTHKSKCSESDTCSFYNNSCENTVTINQKINHLILSSEEISGQNIWKKLHLGEMVGIDENYHFLKSKLSLE